MTQGIPHWAAGQTRHFEVLPPETVLTQLGRRKANGSIEFREIPAWRKRHGGWIEIDVSMLEGRLSIEEAVRFIRRRPVTDRERRQDCVRYFRCGDLAAANYFVLRTPTSSIDIHISVYGNLDEIKDRCMHPDRAQMFVDQGAHYAWWSAPGRVTLESIEYERRLPEDASTS